MAPPAAKLVSSAPSSLSLGDHVTRRRQQKISILNLAGDVSIAKDTFVADDEIPSLAEIKRHIPPHCFRPKLAVSMYYVARDLAFVAALYLGAYATYASPWHTLYLPIFWFFTGFFMWAIFVLGHDCGHGSFSRSRAINSFVGHFLHSAILVPFHSWRISHRKHHKNTGNFEKDEIFYPMTESEYSGVGWFARFVYRELFFGVAFAYPIYLVKGYGNLMSNGSHISVNSELFTKEERGMIATSVSCWWSMLFFLLALGFRYGFGKLFVYYWIPYFVFCSWLLVVTFLHHTEPGTKWYNTKNWNYVKGNLESIDRVYGFFEHFHHDIGTHVVHHLFPAIPHYYLREANKAVKPFLGDLHKIEKQSPMHQLADSVRAWSANHVIPDTTDLFVIPEGNRNQ